MDKCREAFSAWRKEMVFKPKPRDFSHYAIWQAAWQARGKHDAEVCRGKLFWEVLPDSDNIFNRGIEICAQAIEGEE